MRTSRVMVDPPTPDDQARVVQAGEQELVQAVVTQAADEVLDDAVLLLEDDSDGLGDGSCRTGLVRLPFRALHPYDQIA